MRGIVQGQHFRPGAQLPQRLDQILAVRLDAACLRIQARNQNEGLARNAHVWLHGANAGRRAAPRRDEPPLCQDVQRQPARAFSRGSRRAVFQPPCKRREETGLSPREEPWGQLGSQALRYAGLTLVPGGPPRQRLGSALQPCIDERHPQLQPTRHGRPVRVTQELVPEIQVRFQRLDGVPAVTRPCVLQGIASDLRRVVLSKARLGSFRADDARQILRQVEGPSQEIGAFHARAVADQSGELRPRAARQASERGPGRRQARHCARESHRAHELRHLAERGVATEQLVAAKPTERHLDAGLMGTAADPVGVEAVDAGLVHRPERSGDGLEELFLETQRSTWRVPRARATSTARAPSSASVPANSRNRRVIVSGGSARCLFATAATILESSPEERKIATGTSATRCATMLSSIAARMSGSSTGLPRARGRGSGCPTPSRPTHMRWPAGSAFTDS